MRCLISRPDSAVMGTSFQQQQYRFTRHLRDPQGCPAPDDVEDRRMAIYRDLLYRNVEGLVAGAFPVLRRIVPDVAWHDMVRDFFKVHRSRTPYFPKLAREFLHYLQQERQWQETDPPFMLELAQYEHAETMLLLDTRSIPATGHHPDGDLLTGRPVLNPLHLRFTFRWPVHRIGPDCLPRTAPDTPSYLLLCRDHDDQVSFTALNAVSARLVDILDQDAGSGPGRSGENILRAIADELQHSDVQVVLSEGARLLEELRKKAILLGTASDLAAQQSTPRP